MRSRLGAAFALAAGLAAGAGGGAAQAACRLQMVGGPIAVSFANHRAVARAEINGRPVRALIDTGASTSLLFRDAAIRMGLRLDTVSGLRLYGAGGASSVQAATINLKVAGAERRGMRIVVAGERPADVDMLLGQDILQQADVEYDLAHGVMRLLIPDHCADSDMPYWATRYEATPLLTPGAQDDHLVVVVKLNGRPVRAILDTGAVVSIAGPAIAAEAGVPLKRGASAGEMSGLGAAAVPIQRAVVKTVQIGGEIIPDADLVFGDVFGKASYAELGSLLAQKEDAPAEMLLGADFFAAHHVLVSLSHHKVFFSYNGGPVFPAPAGESAAVASGPR